MRRAAQLLTALLCTLYVGLYLGLAQALPKDSWPPSFLPSGLWDSLFSGGTLLALPVLALLAIKKPREAGALLFLTSAAAAFGLMLHAGPHLDRYFPGFLLAVLPQCLVAFLYMRAARSQKPSKPVASRAKRRH